MFLLPTGTANYTDKMKENETKQRLAEAVSTSIDNEPNCEGDSL